jgi:hypothetical protein
VVELDARNLRLEHRWYCRGMSLANEYVGRFMATASVGTAAGEVYEVMRWMMSGSLVAECKADEKPLRLPWSRLLNAYHRSVSDRG